MSESTKAPAPGSASALRQRREAYEIAGSARAVIGDARARLDLGMAKEAGADLNALAKAIDANPEARRMLAEKEPETLRALGTLRAQAAAETPNQVRQTGSTEWQVGDGGGTETKVVFGTSDRGHHNMVLTSERGGEPTGAWSKAFPTAEAAKEASVGAGESSKPATDVWGSRERVGNAARAAEAPKQAQRAGQSMSTGG